MAKIHRNIVIKGLVQGVYFRASAREYAKRAGITGFIRNLPDKSVYAEVEGEEEPVNAFIAWCHEGPPAADVTDVEVKKGNVIGLPSFEILRG